MKMLKSGVLKTVRTYKNKIKRKLFKNFHTNWVMLYIETWSQLVNKKHLIDETVKLVVAFFFRTNFFQFVRKFLNSFLFILFLYVLMVFNTPLFNIFMLLHLSLLKIFIFTLLDNDRWTVETSLSHPDSFYYKMF